MPDGASRGLGWNSIHIVVDEIRSEVSGYAPGVVFRSDILGAQAASNSCWMIRGERRRTGKDIILGKWTVRAFAKGVR